MSKQKDDGRIEISKEMATVLVTTTCMHPVCLYVASGRTRVTVAETMTDHVLQVHPKVRA